MTSRTTLSADDVITYQDRHLKAEVASGDATHGAAREDMRGRWKNPLGAMSWYKNVKREFAALAED
ncbi:MAG: hypothetical protein WAN30_08420 [Acidimicrobiales bacterium]